VIVGQASFLPDAIGVGMRRVVIAAVIILTITSCTASGRGQPSGSSTITDAASSVATPTPDPHWNLVALGDSTAQASACPGCTDYVDLYAKAVAKATGEQVIVDNRAANELSNIPAEEATQLLFHLLTDASLRSAVADADIIVIGIGFNDTPWNRLDDPCDAAPRYPVVEWAKLSAGCIRGVTDEYKQTLDEILTQIDELRGCGEMPGVPPCSQRGSVDTMLRVVSVYNAAIGDSVDPGWDSPSVIRPTKLGNDLFVKAQCEVVHFHGGKCADVYHALNGPNGTRSAGRYLSDWAHLDQRGHRLVASVLIKLGLAPLAY
jgi:lysophospholipase L1-like esterase